MKHSPALCTATTLQNIDVWEFSQDNCGNFYLIANFSISQGIYNGEKNIISLPLLESEYFTSSACLIDSSLNAVPFVLHSHEYKKATAPSNLLTKMEKSHIVPDSFLFMQDGIDEFHIEILQNVNDVILFILHPCIEGHIVCNPISPPDSEESLALLRLTKLWKTDKFEELIPYDKFE